MLPSTFAHFIRCQLQQMLVWVSVRRTVSESYVNVSDVSFEDTTKWLRLRAPVLFALSVSTANLPMGGVCCTPPESASQTSLSTPGKSPCGEPAPMCVQCMFPARSSRTVPAPCAQSKSLHRRTPKIFLQPRPGRIVFGVPCELVTVNHFLRSHTSDNHERRKPSRAPLINPPSFPIAVAKQAKSRSGLSSADDSGCQPPKLNGTTHAIR